MRQTHVKVLMTGKDSTQDESRSSERLLVGGPDDEVETETSQSGIGNGTSPIVGHSVNEEWHVELGHSPIKLFKAEVIGRYSVVGSDVAGDETEIADRSLEFDDRCVRVLHRELRGTKESLGVRCNQRRHRVVGRLRKVDGRGGLDTAEKGERIRRQHLAIDANAIHFCETPLDVHKNASAVWNRLQRVLTDAEEFDTVDIKSVLRSVDPCSVEGTVKHDVSVEIDDSRHGHRP